MVLVKLDSHMQKNEPRPLSYTIHKNKLKMCKDLNVKKESFKILEESTSNNLFDLGHNNFFLDMSPDARETKPNRNHWY